MSEKVTFQELIDSIARETNNSKRFTHDFLKDLVSVIHSGLEEDGSVNIAGFGKFQLRHMEEREGYNPQTGEKMTIEAHNKVVFKPYKDLRELVNAPYNDLEPELLDESEEVEAQEVTESTSDEDEADAPIAGAGAASAEEDRPEAETEDVQDQAPWEAETEEERERETAAEAEGTKEDPFGISDTDAGEEEAETEAEPEEEDVIEYSSSGPEREEEVEEREPSPLDTHLSKAKEEKQKKSDAEAEAEARPEPEEEETEPETEPEPVEEPEPVPASETTFTPGDKESKDSLFATLQKKQSQPWVWGAAAVIGLLIIVLIVLYMGSGGEQTTDTIASEQPPQQAQTEQVTPQQPETQQESQPAETQTTSEAETPPPAESVNQTPDQEGAEEPRQLQQADYVERSVSRGQTLWGLAEQEYEDPYLWPWIYDANKATIRNPNIILVGQSLSIPVPDKPNNGLSSADSLEVAIGYVETYRWYKNNGNDDAKYYLWAAKIYDQNVFDHVTQPIDEDDLAFANRVR